MKNKKIDRYEEIDHVNCTMCELVKDLDNGNLDDSVDSNEVTRRFLVLLNDINAVLFKR